MTLDNYIVSSVVVVGFKEQRKLKFLPEIFLSAEIPFPLKGNRNQVLPFRFQSSRNKMPFTNFGCKWKFWPKFSFF